MGAGLDWCAGCRDCQFPGQFSCSAVRTFTVSLLDRRPAPGLGDIPLVHEVVRLAGFFCLLLVDCSCGLTSFPSIEKKKEKKEKKKDLLCWTMIWGICVVGDESECLDTPISNECGSSIFIWELVDIASFFLRTVAIWMCYPRLLGCICDTDESASIMLWKTLSPSFTISPRNTTRPLYFWYFASNSAFFQMADVHQFCKLNCSARRPCFIDHIFLSSSSTPNFSPNFPIPCPLLLLLPEFSWLEAQ